MTFLTLTAANGNSARINYDSANGITASVGGSTFVGPAVNPRDGNKHFFELRVDENYGSFTYATLYVDGVAAGVTNGAGNALNPGSATLSINMAGLLATDMIDNIEVTSSVANSGVVPSAATTRTANTLALYDFNAGDGSSS